MFQFLSIFIILINNALSQFYYKPSDSDCAKFCFMECDHYRSGRQFRENPQTLNDYSHCIAANSACQCELRPIFKNPLILVSTITVGISVIVILCYIYGKFKLYIMHQYWRNNILSSSTPQSTSPSVNTMPPAVTNYETFAISIQHSHLDIPTPTHRLSDLPEYIPPPSYYECTKNKNSNNDISSPKIVPERSSLKE